MPSRTIQRRHFIHESDHDDDDDNEDEEEHTPILEDPSVASTSSSSSSSSSLPSPYSSPSISRDSSIQLPLPSTNSTPTPINVDVGFLAREIDSAYSVIEENQDTLRIVSDLRHKEQESITLKRHLPLLSDRQAKKFMSTRTHHSNHTTMIHDIHQHPSHIPSVSSPRVHHHPTSMEAVLPAPPSRLSRLISETSISSMLSASPPLPSLSVSSSASTSLLNQTNMYHDAYRAAEAEDFGCDDDEDALDLHRSLSSSPSPPPPSIQTQTNIDAISKTISSNSLLPVTPMKRFAAATTTTSTSTSTSTSSSSVSESPQHQQQQTSKKRLKQQQQQHKQKQKQNVSVFKRGYPFRLKEYPNYGFEVVYAVMAPLKKDSLHQIALEACTPDHISSCLIHQFDSLTHSSSIVPDVQCCFLFSTEHRPLRITTDIQERLENPTGKLTPELRRKRIEYLIECNNRAPISFNGDDDDDVDDVKGYRLLTCPEWYEKQKHAHQVATLYTPKELNRQEKTRLTRCMKQYQSSDEVKWMKEWSDMFKTTLYSYHKHRLEHEDIDSFLAHAREASGFWQRLKLAMESDPNAKYGTWIDVIQSQHHLNEPDMEKFQWLSYLLPLFFQPSQFEWLDVVDAHHKRIKAEKEAIVQPPRSTSTTGSKKGKKQSKLVLSTEEF